jgi:hypothetical protein
MLSEFDVMSIYSAGPTEQFLGGFQIITLQNAEESIQIKLKMQLLLTKYHGWFT